jgi:hypothetical protein
MEATLHPHNATPFGCFNAPDTAPWRWEALEPIEHPKEL